MGDIVIHGPQGVEKRKETAKERSDRQAFQNAGPLNVQVNLERDRRILAGKEFTVTGYATPIAVSGDRTTQMNLLALATAANMRIASGDTTTITKYRDEKNAIHDLTPPQIAELWSLGAAFVSDVYQASWALKDNPGGIPADFKDDTHWPA
jgi:hypothetical protein